MLPDVRIRDCVAGHRPGKKASLQYSDRDRDEEHGEDRERPHGRALDTADDHTPTATGQVADHDDCHGAESNAEPAHVSEEVSAEKFVCAQEGKSERSDTKDGGHDERTLANGLYDRRSR